MGNVINEIRDISMTEQIIIIDTHTLKRMLLKEVCEEKLHEVVEIEENRYGISEAELSKFVSEIDKNCDELVIVDRVHRELESVISTHRLLVLRVLAPLLDELEAKGKYLADECPDDFNFYERYFRKYLRDRGLESLNFSGENLTDLCIVYKACEYVIRGGRKCIVISNEDKIHDLIEFIKKHSIVIESLRDSSSYVR